MERRETAKLHRLATGAPTKTPKTGRKVPKSDTKTQAKVTVNIRLGPVSPAQKQAWKRFWQKLLAEAKASER